MAGTGRSDGLPVPQGMQIRSRRTCMNPWPRPSVPRHLAVRTPAENSLPGRPGREPRYLSLSQRLEVQDRVCGRASVWRGPRFTGGRLLAEGWGVSGKGTDPVHEAPPPTPWRWMGVSAGALGRWDKPAWGPRRAGLGGLRLCETPSRTPSPPRCTRFPPELDPPRRGAALCKTGV